MIGHILPYLYLEIYYYRLNSQLGASLQLTQITSRNNIITNMTRHMKQQDYTTGYCKYNNTIRLASNQKLS